MLPRLTALAVLLALALPAPPVSAQEGELFDAAELVPDTAHGALRAHGDFDGDGDEDLVHTTFLPGWKGITIHLGDGAGAFPTRVPSPFPDASSYGWALRDPAVGDFDGDGNLDVAVDRQGTASLDGVLVLFGDGTGALGSAVAVPLGNYVAALHAGEIDGDAAAEILVHHDDAGFQDHLTWLDWNGAGFTPSVSLPVGGAPDPSGVLVETPIDIDGDGDDDVAAISSTFALVRFFPTVAGSPAYGGAFPVPAPMQDINARLRAGDLDGDGDVDLVHLKMGSGDAGPWVQVYENVGGALAQRPAEQVPTPSTGWFQPHRLRLGDWNGDGWLDLFALNQYLDVLRSDGDWTFSEGFQRLDFAQAPGAGAVDLDGDGDDDYVGPQTIHWSDGTFDGPQGWVTGAAGTFPDGYVPADLEGDGDVDLIGGFHGARAENDGTGAFAYATVDESGPVFPPPPAPGFSYGASSGFADFDGDGRRDLLVEMLFSFSGTPGFVEMRLLVDDGLGRYVDAGVAAPPFVQLGAPGSAPDERWDAADADGDGDVDLLVDGGWWRNTGAGYLDAQIETEPGRVLDATDVDGDGDVDLLSGRKVGATSAIELQRNDGGATTVVALGSLAGDAQARFVDLDADGDLDVAAAGAGELLLAQDEGGAFGAPVVLAATVANLRMLGVGDTDGDGVTDLLALTDEDLDAPFQIPVVTEFLRTGPGLAYAAGRQYVPDYLSAGYSGFLDVDGDGDLDLTGKTTMLGWSVQAPDGGVVQQFGAGLAGTGGAAPVLGAQGPATSTNPGSELRLVQAVGGGVAFVVFSLTEVELADVPLPGLTLFVGAPILTGPYALGGAPGQAGAGELALPLPKLAPLFGVTLVHQAFVVDAGSPAGWTSSNGLRITYGM